MNLRSARILFLAALAVVVMASCSQTKSGEPTTTQLGSLQGRVTEATPAAKAPSRQAQAQLPEVQPGAGLPGVRVTVFLKGQLKTTKSSLDNPKTTDVDEGGYFTIPGLPAGVQLPVTFDREGYVTLNGNVEIPAVAGGGDSAIPLKDPVASIEVGMVKGTGSASLNLDRLIKFKGVLQGIVVDGTPGADKGKALGDVTISLFVGGQVITAKSKTNDEKTAFDETGFFSVPNLPPGQPISATFEKSEYQKTRITVTIPVAEGVEEPAANVEVKLVKGESTKIIEDTVKPLPFNGTIQGIIRDGTVGQDFGKPISGVTLAAMVLGKIVETTSKEDDPLTPGFDETGFFALNNLPIGISIPVRVKKDGYVPVTILASLSAASLGGSTTYGQDVASQVTYDVDLVKDSASLLVIVYGDKGPINGATVVLDLTNVSTATLSNTASQTFGAGFEVYQVKTTDKDGKATFEKLPPIKIPTDSVVIQPVDEDGDKTIDYTTATNSAALDLRQLTSGTGPAIMRFNLRSTNSISPSLLWSNVENKRVINTKDNITLIFTDPMIMPVAEVKGSDGKVTTAADSKSADTAVTLTDPQNGRQVPIKFSWKNNVTLEIDPISDLQPTDANNAVSSATPCGGNCYSLNVRATSMSGVAVTVSRDFRVTEQAAALASPTPGLWPDPAPGVGVLEWNTLSTATNVKWGSDSSAVGYNVYVKDNKLNKDWVRIGSNLTFPATQGTTDAPVIVSTLPALPGAFDKCATVGAICSGTEPYAFGGQLILAVTSINRDGVESPLDEKKTATLGDNTPPSIAALTVSQTTLQNQANVTTGNSANNSGGTCPTGNNSCTSSKTIRIRLTNFPEPMNGSGGGATIIDAASAQCNTGGTVSNTATVTIAAGPTWSEPTTFSAPGLRELFVDLSIPANTTGVGECIKFDLSGVADSAGNSETAFAPAANTPAAGADGSTNSSGEVYIYKLN